MVKKDAKRRFGLHRPRYALKLPKYAGFTNLACLLLVRLVANMQVLLSVLRIPGICSAYSLRIPRAFLRVPCVLFAYSLRIPYVFHAYNLRILYINPDKRSKKAPTLCFPYVLSRILRVFGAYLPRIVPSIRKYARTVEFLSLVVCSSTY